MKNIIKATALVLGLIVMQDVAGVAFGFSPAAESESQPANQQQSLTFDVAADCRTFVSGPNRGDISFVSGKIFPGGSLPAGPSSNDPTQAVNGIAPIGDWTTRGQNVFPFPPSIAASYGSNPTFFATQYYLLNGGRTALTTEGYAFFQGQTALGGFLAITGGIGAFSGTAGEVEVSILGTNATACPNFRVVFNIQPGSIRGRSGK